MTEVIIAVSAVAVIGIVCAVILIVASKYMHVEVDEKEVKIREVLPGANCGACGYTGCDGYAKALASGETDKTNLCVPGADKVSMDIAAITGLEAGDVIALSGISGDADTAMIGFEVFVKGQFVDPADYIILPDVSLSEN